jgi:predicted Zn-dependent protease with MMP-like domain
VCLTHLLPTLGAMPIDLDAAAFDAMVDRALDGLPDELAALVQNVVVLVEDDAPPDDPDLLGLYDGLALTERQANHAGMLPDRILLFRGPLLDMADTEEDLEEEVRITVVHEVAHHFGLDDRRLHELGWG